MTRLVKDSWDREREQLASRLYEELRLLSNTGLRDRLWEGKPPVGANLYSRQSLIAEIIERELPI